MDIAEFRDTMMAQIRFASSADGTSDKEEFLNFASEMLMEAEQLDDMVEFLPFEGVGTNRRKIQIEGYSYNELDDYLTIYTVADLTYGDIETLTSTEANKYLTRARTFIEDAKYITETAEESAPAYGLAIDILKKYSAVRKYCIFLLSDMSMSKNIKVMDSGEVNGIPVEYHIWDINRLHQLAESKSGKEDIIIDMTEFTECAINRTHNLGSITDISFDMLPKKIDLLTYSFPCQDLSICGSWHGNMSGIDRDANNRSGMLWEVERILKEMKEANRRLPKFLLMENVSNILSKTHLGNFQEWQGFLESLGYVNKVYTLNAANFGSPQKRVRTYMLSVLCLDDKRKRVIEHFFSENDLEKQPPLKRRHISTCLRTDYAVQKYKKEADISNMNDTPSRRKIFEDNDVIYDGEAYLTDTVNTLTTKQDRNPTSGMVIYPEHGPGKSIYRNFTPRECFLMMGFDEEDYDAIVENNILIRKNKYLFSREKCEKLAGNSIVVDVLVAIFRQVDELNKMLWSGQYIPRNGVKRNYQRREHSMNRT